jgi:signal transduction histidine kinase
VRRRVSESLHDGPLQELIGLDMVLTAAHREVERESAGEALRLLDRALETTERNVQALRDEMLGLGPYAFEEASLEATIERCVPVWRRRYDLRTSLAMDPVELPPETEGALFRIVQEAVVNAAKHGRATSVTIELRSSDAGFRLSIADDGAGFGEVDPLDPAAPGHIGLAGIRERAQLLGGELAIDSSAAGTSVTIAAPLNPDRREGGD